MAFDLRTFSLSVEGEEFFFESPERSLFAAVLDRAARDLSTSTPPTAHKTAIDWFLDKPLPCSEEKITFEMCIEVLDLGPPQVEELLTRAKQSKNGAGTYIRRNRSRF